MALVMPRASKHLVVGQNTNFLCLLSFVQTPVGGNAANADNSGIDRDSSGFRERATAAWLSFNA
jgi:hypothetical protein